MSATMQAPWTDAQIQALREHQADDMRHPYTSTAGKTLIPTRAGWVEEHGGPVVQTWAHEPVSPLVTEAEVDAGRKILMIHGWALTFDDLDVVREILLAAAKVRAGR